MENNELRYKGSADFLIDKTEKNGLSPPIFNGGVSDSFQRFTDRLSDRLTPLIEYVVGLTMVVGIVGVFVVGVFKLLSVLFADISTDADRLTTALTSFNVMYHEAIPTVIIVGFVSLIVGCINASRRCD